MARKLNIFHYILLTSAALRRGALRATLRYAALRYATLRDAVCNARFLARFARYAAFCIARFLARCLHSDLSLLRSGS